ncbi:hypothetical protein EMCRGX_G033938 [Ephydatia muelleri]|eukprot:Em0022g311a
MAQQQRKESREKTDGYPSMNVIRLQFILGLSLTVVIFYGGCVYCDSMSVPNEGSMNFKVAYTFRCAFLAAMCLLVLIFAVVIKRGALGAINPLGGKEHLIQVDKNVLTNTVEQFLVYLVSVMALATYLDTPEQLKLIPLYTTAFIVGRILFRIGYGLSPGYRTVGMTINFASSVYIIGFTLYLMYTKGFMYNMTASGGVPSAGREEL